MSNKMYVSTHACSAKGGGWVGHDLPSSLHWVHEKVETPALLTILENNKSI